MRVARECDCWLHQELRLIVAGVMVFGMPTPPPKDDLLHMLCYLPLRREEKDEIARLVPEMQRAWTISHAASLCVRAKWMRRELLRKAGRDSCPGVG